MKRYFSLKSIFSIAIAFLLTTVMLMPASEATVYANLQKSKVDIAETYEIGINESITLNASGDKVEWKSSNKKVATVSQQGVVTGKKEGSAIITVTVTNKRPAKNWIESVLEKFQPRYETTVTNYKINVKKEIKPTNPTKPENPSDADNYYWDNSEEVIKVINAKESEDIQTESEVVSFLKERGFGDDFEITYNSDMDGNYVDDTEIAEDSTDKHPMYETSYIAENGDVWTIFVVNGAIFARPVSFNLESELEAELLFSETKEITSYDDETNKFYVTIPKESAAIVKVVDKIDAETLDKLTVEVINNYEK